MKYCTVQRLQSQIATLEAEIVTRQQYLNNLKASKGLDVLEGKLAEKRARRYVRERELDQKIQNLERLNLRLENMVTQPAQ